MLRYFVRFGALSALCLVGFAIFVAVPASYPDVQFPEGKRFAFTILDDTDGATLESVKPVYEFLADQGLRITKTVWVLPGTEQKLEANRGESLADRDYRAFSSCRGRVRDRLTRCPGWYE